MLPRDREFRFGPFVFSRTRGLSRSGRAVPLRHLERQLLKCLLDRAGEIVRREEIEAALWPSTHVAPNTVNVVIRRLRVVLGDTKAPHRMLKSVPKMGYLLVATPAPGRVAQVEMNLARRDSSRFVRDITVPDGSLLAPGERFEKIWEIQNSGSVAWIARSLQRVGACSGPGRITSDPTVVVPDTPPGNLCAVRAELVAPLDPGSYYAAWKMVDSDGQVVFRRQRPLFVSIDVVEVELDAR